MNKVLLDCLIEGRICHKAGSVVNLQQVRSCFAVYHNIEAQKLETHVTRVILNLAGSILMSQQWSSDQEGFDDDIVYLLLELLHLYTLPFEQLIHGG